MSTGNELVARVRDIICDRKQPSLWSTELILRYLSEAANKLCSATHLLIDTSYLLGTAADKPTYKLKNHVLRVYAGRIAGENQLLKFLRGSATYWQVRSSSDKPTSFTLDMGHRYVTFNPIPDAVYSIEFICAVRPKEGIQKEQDSGIPEEHDQLLIDYATSRCLLTSDRDGEDSARSIALRELWAQGVRELKQDIYRSRTPDILIAQSWEGM
jgi:hypothetical protein